MKYTHKPALPRLITIATLILFILVLVTVYIRGTWADTNISNPQSVADGVQCQLYQIQKNERQIRCSLLLDATPEQVWSIITDYKNFEAIFTSWLWTIDVQSVTAQANGYFHLIGEVTAKVLRFPMDAHIQHVQESGQYIAHWDESNTGNVKRNRGSWTISSTDNKQTLLVYALQVEVNPYPQFFINSVVLDQLAPVLELVKKRLRQTTSA